MSVAKSNIRYSSVSVLILIPMILYGCLNNANRHNLNQAITFEKSEPRKATDLYKEIIRTEPNTILAAEAHYRLGLHMLTTAKKTSALNHFRKIAEIKEFFPWNTAAQIELTGLNDIASPQTIDLLNEFIAVLDNSGLNMINTTKRAHLYIAEFAFTLGDCQLTLDSLQTANFTQDESIQNYRCLYLKGSCLAKLNESDNALNYLTQALEHPESQKATVLLEIIDLFDKMNRFSEAIDLSIQYPSAFSDRSFRNKFNLLSSKVSGRELDQLVLEHTTGYGAMLLRLEVALRLQNQGEIEMALKYLKDLQRTYPRYRSSISDLANNMKQLLNVSPEKIGILIPLSGQLTSIGQSIFRGAQQAISDYHDAGGSIPFNLIVKDTSSKSQTIDRLFHELESEEQVFALLGPLKSNVTKMLMPLCNEKMIPLITPACPNNQIVSMSPWAFRIFPSPQLEMEELIKFSVRDLALTKFACLYPDIDYARSAVENLEQIIHDERADLVFFKSYPKDLSTIRNVIHQMKDLDIDAIIIPDSAERVSNVAGQIRYQELLLPTIIGIGAWDESILLEVAGNNLDGSYFISEYPTAHGPRAEIAKRYSAQFGELPDAFSLRSYEAMYLIISAVEKGVHFRSQLKSWLTGNDGLNGLDGKAWFNSEGNYEPALTIYKIHGNEYTAWRTIQSVPEHQE